MRGTENFTLSGGRGYRGLLQVGLVNNMPDAGLRATELQFARLLKDAAGALDVRLRLFSPRSIARSQDIAARMEGFYDDCACLQDAGMDALIITGAGAAEMRDAPFWPELAQVIDWASTGTISTIFSGSAAQAAVRHLDGIVPRPLPQALSGVFTSRRAMEDPLLFQTAAEATMPHARQHGLVESDLAASGYRILSRLSEGAADVFTREPPGHSRFVFLQGHPEYDDAALGRAHLQEMESFLRGGLAERPPPPQNYFDRATENRLAGITARSETALALYGETVRKARPLQSWHGHAVRLFANWLTLAAAARTRRSACRAVSTRRRVS